jgi:hypothetical protein
LILTEAKLLRLCGLKQRAALRRHLKRAGIPYRELGGRITTTEQAFTDTLSGRAKKKKGINLDACR